MRIAVAQLNYKIGDFAGNGRKISTVIEQQHHDADLIVFSELCLSGYYPRDLIFNANFMVEQDKWLAQIQRLTQQYSCAVVIGLVTKNTEKGQAYHNSLVLISKGTIAFIYHKRLLPVYNIFNEARHFAPGQQSGIVQFKDTKIGFLICEDGWAALDNYLYPCDPVDDLKDASVDIIICLNGSPSNSGKQLERSQRFSAIARTCQAPLLFTNQIGGNDDIVYDGASFICDNKGELVASLPAFVEAQGLVTLTERKLTVGPGFSGTLPMPPIQLFYQQMLLGLADYVFKCGFKKVVLGISGGIDSALTLALAVQALGATQVTALAMPSRYSSPASLTDSQTLCENLGVKLYVVPIEDEFMLTLAQFKQWYGEPASMITEQNIQARLRGRLLMEYSNQTGALVLSTGNKSELSVGYTTLYGDMTGGFNLIGDLYKTEVYQVAEFYNQLNPTLAIPQAILTKAPSAELSYNQKDSDNLPEYKILDPILKLYIEGDLLPADEIAKCQHSLARISSTLIQQVHEMVDKAEFKRRQAAPIIRLQRRAFGYGRQFPIAATYPVLSL